MNEKEPTAKLEAALSAPEHTGVGIGQVWLVRVKNLLEPKAILCYDAEQAKGWEETGAEVTPYVPAVQSTGVEEAVETIARAFHDEYEAFAEMHGWESQKEYRVAFEDLPVQNQRAMLDTVQALLDRKVIAADLPKSEKNRGGVEEGRLTQLLGELKKLVGLLRQSASEYSEWPDESRQAFGRAQAETADRLQATLDLHALLDVSPSQSQFSDEDREAPKTFKDLVDQFGPTDREKQLEALLKVTKGVNERLAARVEDLTDSCPHRDMTLLAGGFMKCDRCGFTEPDPFVAESTLTPEEREIYNEARRSIVEARAASPQHQVPTKGQEGRDA